MSWRNLLLQVVLAAGTYLVIEAGYRVFQYLTLPDRIVALVQSKGPTTISAYVFDGATGYRYAPNYVTSAWRTNSYGHISNTEYPIAKPAKEYRIAAIGDSYTAGINDTVRWTDILEADLNGSPKWKAKVGGAFTRVINFGVDGFGMVQMSAMLTNYAMQFEPDLVVVNFIVEDILRPLTYRQAPSADSDELSAYVRSRFLSHVDWLSPCPAVISETVGRLWDMNCALPLRADAFLAANPELRYERRDGLQHSATAVRAIQQAAPNAMFLQAPLVWELRKTPIPEWIGLVEDLQHMVPEFKVILMSPAFASIPYESLFIPRDGHYSDEGAIVYGHAVARELMSSFIQGR
jgi:hypothetical protein